MRLAKDGHWLPDVLAGAGVGILSTEAADWRPTHRVGNPTGSFQLLP